MNIEYVQLKNVFNELNKEQFVYQRSQFLNRKPNNNLKFQLLTFNVAQTQQIQSSTLERIIVGGNDIYVICLQEVSMKASTILTSDAKQTKIWIDEFYQTITRVNNLQQTQQAPVLSYNYSTKQLGGLLMMVFYNNKIKIEAINDVSCGFLGGLIANKGGIYIIVQYQSARMLFLGCHLSADRSPSGFMQRTTNLKDILNVVLQNEQRRQQKVKKISRGVLPSISYLYNQNTKNPTQTLPEYKLTAWNDALSSFEAVFILGDLNYRTQLSIQHSYQLITRQEYQRLLEFDELTWLRNGTNQYQYVDEEEPSKSIIPKQNKQQIQENISTTAEKSSYQSSTDIINDIFNRKNNVESLEAQSLPFTSVGSPVSDSGSFTPILVNNSEGNKGYVISSSEHAKNIPKVFQQQQNQIFYIHVAQNPLIQTFVESQINFPPTYKIKNGQYNQKRSPSYCDRIIYCVNNDSINLTVQSYLSNFDIDISDHKPVYLVGQLNGFSATQPDQQKIAIAEQEWNQILQVFQPDLQLISNKDIIIECLNFGEIYQCPIVIQNNHDFSNVIMQIETDYPFVSFTQQQIEINPNQKTTFNANVQILNRNIQARTATIKMRSMNGMINFTVTINVQNINMGILQVPNQLNALVSIGHVLLLSQNQPVPKDNQQRINYFYEYLNRQEFKQEQSQNTLLDVYHTLNNYLLNSELLSGQQIELLEKLIINKFIIDMDDFKIFTQQYLPLQQYEIMTYALQLTIYLKQILQQHNVITPEIQLIRFQNQKTQKIFDKIVQ